MSTPILQVIQELNREVRKLEAEVVDLRRQLREEREYSKGLQQDYACAVTDLEHTRKELLRARS